MPSQSTLFLAQSYMDTWDDYKRSLTRDNFACWDYVILTASNPQQAQGFEAQIAERQKAGFLPRKTHFAVIPDKDGKPLPFEESEFFDYDPRERPWYKNAIKANDAVFSDLYTHVNLSEYQLIGCSAKGNIKTAAVYMDT